MQSSTAAAFGCFAIGGAPGESVYMMSQRLPLTEIL